MTLYEVIIKEFSDDDNIKNLGKLFSGNPIDNGVSEEEFRSTFVNAVGYDPTTMYDFKKIDDITESMTAGTVFDGDESTISSIKASSKHRFLEEKTSFIKSIVTEEINGESTNEDFSDDFDDDDDFDDIDIDKDDFDDEDDEEV